jgi:hypothetical protein
LYKAQELVDLVGLQPTRLWSVGSKRGQTSIIEQNNGWQLDSTLPPTCSIAEHLVFLLKKTKVLAERIAKLSDTGDVEVEVLCSVYARTEPSLYLHKDIVVDIAKLHAHLDFDVVIVDE